MPPQMLEALKPEYVAPLAAYLSHESCEESGSLFEVGAGFHAKLRWERTVGHHFQGKSFGPEEVAEKWAEIGDFNEATYPKSIGESLMSILQGVASPFGQGKN
jgi:3-hydroxyacyl-CoA dehydrogenase/3a,7a,12a-trihydroxy-5b-cholest-24-enoyl-CoA hydratase